MIARHAVSYPDNLNPYLVKKGDLREEGRFTEGSALAFESGQVDGAIGDLTHAIALGENAAALYN